MCWHDCARIHPNIDNSRNAIYSICRGWMAAGYQMKGNIVFYPMTKYFFKYNEPFFRNASFNIDRLCHKTKSESRIWYFFSMFPGTPDAQTAAAKWLRGSKWKAILFAICWRKIFQFERAIFRQYTFDSTLAICGYVGMIAQEYILISIIPRTPYTQSAAAEWLRGIKWKAILFSICWRNTFQI